MKRAGWKVQFVPAARTFHAQGQSVGSSAHSRITFYRSRYIYFRKWHRASYLLAYLVIFVRLLINVCLNFVGVVVTLGLNTGLRKKLLVYTKLILWHLQGCPED